MLEYVKSEIKPDIFFWTGDNSAHNVWENNNDEVTASTINITKIIQEHFVDTNISVFPIQGNHDTWPVNVEDFTLPNSNIQVEGLLESWAEWLEPETLE